jgi:hypothetical protein
VGGIPISTPTIQNALFRSSSTVEQAAVKEGRSVASPENCSTFKIETAIKCGQSPFFVLQFEHRAGGCAQCMPLPHPLGKEAWEESLLTTVARIL